MNFYEVSFHHSINRESSGSFSTNYNSQGTMVVPALSATQARQLVEAMHGGYQNCEVRSVIQKY